MPGKNNTIEWPPVFIDGRNPSWEGLYPKSAHPLDSVEQRLDAIEAKLDRILQLVDKS